MQIARRGWPPSGAWIDRGIAAGEGGVITCSALKGRLPSETLTKGRPAVRIIYLEGHGKR